MRKLALLHCLLICQTTFAQGYKVYMSDGKVDAYLGETAVSVSLNDDSLRYNGHEYVDLGLPSGTRWSTTNVGAKMRDSNGLHFTFAFAKTNSQWGGDWRMPGILEYQELLRYCQWEWTKEGISQGYMVKGPNGNELFLPAAGYIEPVDKFTSGLTGQLASYWTSEGYSFNFSSSAKGLSKGGSSLLLSLRPVIGGKVQPDVRSEVVKDGPHEYVDLGLSVLWATTNIGADTPEAFGDYFAPGGTEPMPFNSDNLFHNGNYVFNYYYLDGREEEYENWYQQSNQFQYLYECGYWILPKHDAATMLWGDGWRMPTLSEYKELFEKTTRIGNTPYIFKGSNGNMLTLPKAGYYEDNYFNYNYGYYLTSSITGLYPMIVDVSQGDIRYSNESKNRSFYTIRPVRDKPKAGLTDETTTAQREMVDLGLSVLWANCNWGAATPPDKGEYVAWGETFPKSEYTESNYKLVGGYSQQSLQTMFGKAGWTLPTSADVQDLIRLCTWARETDGYRVTGPNGNSILLPYTGYRDGIVLNYPDELGLYRTIDGLALQLCADGKLAVKETNNYVGLAIRPVMPRGFPETGDAQTDWHSATIVCKANIYIYREYGIQLSYIENMDNTASGAWNVQSNSGSMQNGEYTTQMFLQPNTRYYYRAYVVTEDGTTLYGDIKQLHTTADVPAVDLGLSVKWASVNLGATSEDDFADWYVNPSVIYDNMGKLPPTFYGIRNNSNLIPLSSWDEEWRLPTEAEFQELIEKCIWIWQEGGYSYVFNGWNHNGYKVFGPNGNSIFLQANGIANGNNMPSYFGTTGYYWTQTPSERYAGCNNILKITATDKKISFGPTNATYNIRPVKK